MLAEQSSFRASGRWLRCGEQCIYRQALGPRWRPLSRPTCITWRQFGPAWYSGGK